MIRAGLDATISAVGAELRSLRDGRGRELMWQAGPLWPNHSPVLFPIVGQLDGDRLQVDGRSYPMTRHGFARRRPFEWSSREATRCSLLLRDDEETRAVFPFAFRLEITYSVGGSVLTVGYRLSNGSDGSLPASLGAHPAFRWPLYGGRQTDYRIEFSENEPAPIHRLQDGLLDPVGRQSPIRGNRLSLDPALFRDDAVIMLSPSSRSLRYVGPDGGLEFSWSGFPQLGLWQKPGAEFICLEPWHGYSSPIGWAGEFADKPGLFTLQPGESRDLSWSVRPLPGDG